MNRSVIWTCLLMCLLALGACSSVQKQDPSGRVNHLVLCCLKEPGNAEHRRLIVEQTRAFRQIPGVLEVRVGEVLPSERKLVDDSFDIGILLSFSDAESMGVYIAHPEHRKAVKQILIPLVSRILVYDFVEP